MRSSLCPGTTDGVVSGTGSAAKRERQPPTLKHAPDARLPAPFPSLQLDPQQLQPVQRNVGQLAELSRQLKAKTPRLDAVREANVGVRLLARQGVDADTLSRDVADFELRTTCVGGVAHA